MGGSLHRVLIAIAIALAFSLLPAAGWAPETRVSMIDEAVRLMPASLRAALEHHREEVLRGMLAPMVREDDPEHRPPWDQGTLDAAVDREARGLLETLGRQSPFGEIARRFGSVAHYVSDAGFPPTASKVDGAVRYAHFARFCEERRERFPVVFYGHHDEDLASGDWAGFALQVMNRAGLGDVELARAYAAAGNPPDPAAFDDRSVPFAVGSLSYSRSITDIVRIWLGVWEQAEGDMGRIPYWTLPETGNN
jgi:hypothetical protein